MAKKIKNAPGWLGLSSDRTSFIYLPDRAEIVQQIFELSIGGFGGRAIANLLNKKQVPAFGSSKKWDQSTIHNMLTSRATIGEYQRKQTIDGREEPIGDPVPDYYPLVINLETFEAAQSSRRNNIEARSGRRGKLITNLFFDLASCFYCAEAVRFHSNAKDKSLLCRGVMSGRNNCHRFAWTYTDFENSFFEAVERTARYPKFSEILFELRTGVQQDDETRVLDARMHVVNFLRASLRELTIAVAGATPPAPKPHLVIRRDYPGRFFKVQFLDGFSLVGYPPPLEPAGLKIPALQLGARLGLSPRQAEITSLLVQGFDLKQAAEKLGQSHETGRWHLREIFRRTNTHSQGELIDLAERTSREMS